MTPEQYTAAETLERLTQREGRTVKIQGQLLQYRTWHAGMHAPTEVKRGEIKGFSNAARLRLLKFIATIEWEKIPHSVFLTLTYPDTSGLRTRKQRNTDKYLFIRHIEKHLSKNVCGIWRLEEVLRKSGDRMGEPEYHWHIILFDVRFISYKIINLAWQKTLGIDSYVRTDIRAAKNQRMAAYYVAKYVAKPPTALSLVNAAYLNNPGRSYGYLRKALIPMANAEMETGLTEGQVAWLLDYANGCCDWINKDHKTSFTLLGPVAVVAAEKIREFAMANRKHVG